MNDINLKSYTFSKSETTTTFHNEISFKVKIFSYNSKSFEQYYTNSDIILVLFKNACIGLFLTQNEANLFQIITNHIDYFNEIEQDQEFHDCKEEQKCIIINLPNVIDPRFTGDLLQLPKYANIKVTEWDQNFKILVRELDPFFPEESILEEKVLEETDILECRLCGVGFIMSENTNQSCCIHPGTIKFFTQYPRTRYSCCGLDADEGLNTIGCRKGYHIPKYQ